MALLQTPLDQIDEPRLQALIDAKAAESRSIEYKRATYGASHSDDSEFLADVSSFANTSGGDLALGIAATNGIPTDFSPLDMPMDAEILRSEPDRARRPSAQDYEHRLPARSYHRWWPCLNRSGAA